MFLVQLAIIFVSIYELNAACDPALCDPHGQCFGDTCFCDGGWVGNHCQFDVNECLEDTDECRDVNTEQCVNQEGSYECRCKAGFKGDFCQEEIDLCVEELPYCQNSGTCTKTGPGSAQCNCPNDFTGEKCESVILSPSSSSLLPSPTPSVSESRSIPPPPPPPPPFSTTLIAPSSSPALPTSSSIAPSPSVTPSGPPPPPPTPPFFFTSIIDAILTSSVPPFITSIPTPSAVTPSPIPTPTVRPTASKPPPPPPPPILPSVSFVSVSPTPTVPTESSSKSPPPPPPPPPPLSSLPVSQTPTPTPVVTSPPPMPTSPPPSPPVTSPGVTPTPTEGPEEPTTEGPTTRKPETEEPTPSEGPTGDACSVFPSPCVNGECRNTPGGFFCLCDYPFVGDNCTIEADILVPKFGTDSYLLLSHLLSFRTNSLVFDLRSTSSNGLVFFTSQYNDGSGDFVALSLINGHLRFVFRTGINSELSLTSTVRIDDGNWHTVSATRNRLAGTLIVDQEPRLTGTAPGPTVAVNLQRPANIYIGGVPAHVRPPLNIDTQHFEGCIREMELDREGIDFDGPEIEIGVAVEQCIGFGPCAVADACRNGGTCTETGVRADDFICNCTANFGGPTCNEPVDRCVSSNGDPPCRNGGTCVNALSTDRGFKCACPYGFTGIDCEKRIGIVAPELFGDSYVAYQVDGKELLSGFVLEFDLRLGDVSSSREYLIAYLGDRLPSIPDFFAVYVTFVRQIAIQINCGSGEEDVTSSSLTPNQWTRIKIELNSFAQRNLALQLWIDGLRVVTVPLCSGNNGTFHSLDVGDTLYIGGINPKLKEIVSNATIVPTDGLIGCVANLTLIGSLTSEDLIAKDDSPTGANIGSCFVHACDAETSLCRNNGTCRVDGATFYCDCPSEYLPPYCETSEDACNPNPCNTSEGGVCRSQAGEFLCICGKGLGGRFCNESLVVEHNVRGFAFELESFITFEKPRDVAIRTDIEVYVRPSVLTGLVLYVGSSTTDFISISLVDGHVDFRYDLGSGQAMIQSVDTVKIDQWNKITAKRTRRDGTLSINGSAPTSGSSRGGLSQLNLNGELFIGGVAADLGLSERAGTLSSFTGCIGELSINGILFDFDGALRSRGVGQCSISPCRGHDCQNGGTCVVTDFVLDETRCDCPSDYGGDNCERFLESCAAEPCRNGGTCTPTRVESGFVCTCPIGFTGATCESLFAPCSETPSSHPCDKDDQCRFDLTAMEFYCVCPVGKGGLFCRDNLTVAVAGRFRGNGGIEVFQRDLFPRPAEMSFTIVFNASSDGLLAYLPEDDRGDFFSLGIQSGTVEFRVDLGSGLLVLSDSSGINVADGNKHEVKVDRKRQNVDLIIDGQTTSGTVRGFSTGLNTNKNVFFGGVIGQSYAEVSALIEAEYTSGLIGCLDHVTAGLVTVFPLGGDNVIQMEEVTQCF